MATIYTFNDISLGQVGLYLKDTAGADSRVLVGEVQNVTPPSIVRTMTEVPNGLSTPEVEGAVQALRYAVTLNAWVDDVLDYFLPTFGTIYPAFEVVRLLQTDSALGRTYKTIIDEVEARLIEWSPQQTQQGSLATYNMVFAVEKYVQYTIHLGTNASGQMVKVDGPAGDENQTNAGPENDVYAEKTTAPSIYLHPLMGHFFTNGNNVMVAERAIANLGTILNPPAAATG